MNKSIKYPIFFLLFALIYIGCDKNDPLITRGVGQTGAAIKLMHLSPDAPSFNLFIDTGKVTATSANTITGKDTGIVFGVVIPTLSGGYAYIPSGTHNVVARVPLSSPVFSNQTILSKSYTFTEGKFYTIALVDSLTSSQNRLDVVIVEDDLSIPDTSKSYFRLANFMLGGTADVEFIPTSTTAYSFMKNGIPYKTVTNFDTLTPAASYKILLRANGTSARLDSIGTFTPAKGRKYTLYTRGVVLPVPNTNTKRALIFQITNF